jgi:hypothetical protein
MRLILFSLAAFGIGCSSHPSRESTLQGSAALTSFSSTPTAVRASDETGRTTTAPVAPDGSFSVALARGHLYKVTFVTDAGEVPLVYPRQTGKLDATFLVRSNGAKVHLGAVRRLPNAPQGGFHALSTQPPRELHDDEVDDDQKVSCDDDRDGKNEAEAADSGEQADSTRELAVGERNAPERVDGCEGENETDD